MRESILDEHPIPENVAEVYPKRLDEFTKDILKRSPSKVQKRLVNITGARSPFPYMDGGRFHEKDITLLTLTFIASTKPKNKR